MRNLPNRGKDTQTQVMTFERPTDYTSWRPPNPPVLTPGEPIGLDFEYRPHDNPARCRPFAVSVYSHEQKMGWYLPWAHEGGGNLPQEIVERWLRTELKDRDFYGVATKFEVHMLKNLGIEDADVRYRPHDVAFNAALLNENRYSGFSLEAMCEEYLPPEERKVHPVTVDPKDFWRAHAGEVAERGVADARQALLIHLATKPEMEKQRLTRVQDLEDRCIFPTVEAERNGALLDRSLLERWSIALDEHISRLYTETYNKYKLPVNPNKPREMLRYFQELKLNKPTTFDEDIKQEVESWDAEAIEKVCLGPKRAVINEDVYRVYLLKHYMSLKSKYVEKYLHALDGTNHVYFSLHQLRSDSTGEEKGTTTGRYSCGGGKYNINIQQVPKVNTQLEEFGDEFIIRDCFIAAAGKQVGASDASQIEFRLFGHLARSKFLIESYARDPMLDFHMMVTRMMMPDTLNPTGADRDKRKHQNFGKIYGLGRPKLARKLGLGCVCPYNWYERDDDNRRVRYFHKNSEHLTNCPARKANDITDEYEKKFPEAGEQLQHASDLARKLGYVTTAYGRRRRFPEAQKLHKALNARVQGTAADYFKEKACTLYRERARLGITLRLFVHDEFVYDVATDPAAVLAVQEVLDRQELDLTIPLLWETGVGPNWRRANKDKEFMKTYCWQLLPK